MALKLTRMHVYLAPQNGGQDPEEYDVEIRHVDRLRAELELSKSGATMELGYHATAAMTWAALVREKHYDKPFAVFNQNDCLDFDQLGEEDVDPTPPREPIGSLSDSPTDSLAAASNSG